MDDKFQSVEKLMGAVCWKFTKERGGECDEAYSVAIERYPTMVEKYDRRIPFPKWIARATRYALLDWEKQRRREHSQFVRFARLTQDQRTQERFDAIGFLRLLSEDAKEITQLIWGSPGELRLMARIYHVSMANVLKIVLGDLGWSSIRVRKSFAEITEALD